MGGMKEIKVYRNCIFIFGGKWLVSRIANSMQYINWVIGGIFAITAIIHLYKILSHKAAADKIHDLKPENIPKVEEEPEE